MDMYQKRKIRAEKKNNNQEEKLTKVGINWYPGHMFKTKKEIKEDIALTDLVVEILDARAPISSRNTDILNITENKKRIIVLNKEDLADEKESIRWQEYFSAEANAILLNSEKEQGFDKILSLIDNIMKDKIEKDKSKGIKQPVIRLMIVGIPNSGKSSFINRISKRKTMEVGNRPGVTKQKQWIRIDNNKEILDTPRNIMAKIYK